MPLLSGTNFEYVLEPNPNDNIPNNVIVVTRDLKKYKNKRSGKIAYLFGPHDLFVFKKTRAMSKYFKSFGVEVGSIFCPISYRVITAPLDFAIVYGNHPVNWTDHTSHIIGDDDRIKSTSKFMKFEENYPVKHPDFYDSNGKQKYPSAPSHVRWADGINAKEKTLVFKLREEIFSKGDEPPFVLNFIEGFPISSKEDETVFLVE